MNGSPCSMSQGTRLKSSDGAVIIDNAEVERALMDACGWPTGMASCSNGLRLPLGWLTFPVPDAAPGSFKVTVNSVQADGNHVRGAWQLPKFPGLEARSDVLKPIVIDSDLCVSSGSVAFGFHDRACAQGVR